MHGIFHIHDMVKIIQIFIQIFQLLNVFINDSL